MQSQSPQPRPLLISETDSARPPRSVVLLAISVILAKVVTIVVVFAMDFSVWTAALVAITTWTWLALAAFVLAQPTAFRMRLHRVRSRREQLQRSEWIVDEPTASRTPR